MEKLIISTMRLLRSIINNSQGGVDFPSFLVYSSYMRFTKKVPKTEGFYWYKKHPAYSPTIGHLLEYGDKSGWFVLPFGYDVNEDHSLTGKELWGSRIKEP